MSVESTSRSGYARLIPGGFVALGIGSVLAQIVSAIAFGGVGSLATESALLGVALTALFAIPVVAGGLWLTRRNVSPDRYPRVAGWCLAILAVILALNLVMIAAWTTGSVYQDLAWAIQAATMGAAGGTVFGAIEARSIERARAAERAAVRSEQLEAQREWLEYLNSLLRHEVLNTANVIVGYSELLLAEHEGDEGTRDRLERIARQSRKMTDVIQDVRLLIQATNEDVDFEPTDLVEVLDREVRALRDRFAEVAVETDFPNRAPIMADEIVARVFSNVLSNAVEHNDAGTAHLDVSIQTDEETVTVRIADDGPGISQEERATLFERSGRGTHGLGLYLVRTLVERYGGSIELGETGPEGSTFLIAFPRAEGGLEQPQADAVAVDAA